MLLETAEPPTTPPAYLLLCQRVDGQIPDDLPSQPLAGLQVLALVHELLEQALDAVMVLLDSLVNTNRGAGGMDAGRVGGVALAGLEADDGPVSPLGGDDVLHEGRPAGARGSPAGD